MKLNKKKSIILIVLIVIIAIFSVSMAYFREAIFGNRKYVIKASQVLLRLNETSSSISLGNTLPQTDEDGMNNDAYTFSLENLASDLTYRYSIYLVDDTIPDGDERASDQFIKYYLTNDSLTTQNDPALVSTLTTDENGRILETGIIEKGDIYNYTLRFWIDYDATQEDVAGKVFSVKLNVLVEEFKEIVGIEASIVEGYEEVDTGTTLTNDMFNVVAVYSDGSRVTLSADSGKYVIDRTVAPSDEGQFGINISLNQEMFDEDVSTITANVNLTAVIPPPPVLVTGKEFNATIPSDTTQIIFTDEKAPDGYSLVEEEAVNGTLTDVSEAQNGSIVAWSEDTTYKVSTQVNGVKAVANEDSSKMFSSSMYGGNTINVMYIDVSMLDTYNVTDMSQMFAYIGRKSTEFNIIGLNTWDTSSVTDMSYMFDYSGVSSQITSYNIGDLSGWDTSSVTDMSYMFAYANRYATTLNIGDLSNWDVSNVTNMSHMFISFGSEASTLELNLSGWDTSSVTSMSWMFGYIGSEASTVELELSGWDTSSVTDMSGMFAYIGRKSNSCNIIGLSKLNTSKVTNMRNMFTYACQEAEEVEFDLSKKEVTKSDGTPYTAWDTSSVTDMSYMFNCFGSKLIEHNNIGLNTWDTSSVTDMSYMFNKFVTQVSTVELDLSGWDTSSVTDMSYMFSGIGSEASTLELNLSGWNTLSVTDMSYMFEYAGDGSNITEFIITGLNTWKTQNVTNMSYMFRKAGYYATTFNIGSINIWNTSSVTDMSYMFYYAGYSSNWKINLKSWNVKKVTSYTNFNYGVTSKVTAPTWVN